MPLEVRPWREFEDFLATVLAGEAGEVAELVGKSMRESFGADAESAEIDPVKLALELGDVLWCTGRLARLHSLTLAEVATLNRMKLERRRAHGKDPAAELQMARDFLEACEHTPPAFAANKTQVLRYDVAVHPAEKPGPTGCLIRDDGLCLAGPGRCEHTRPTVEIVRREITPLEFVTLPPHPTPPVEYMPVIDAGVVKNWINTFTGKKFYPLAPAVDEVHLVDIAHALSNQCRYTGHGKFYSVAEHSVKLAMVLNERGGSVEEMKYALLHDASEAYLADIATPVKHHPDFAFYRQAEDHLQSVIFRAFKLDPNAVPPLIHELDVEIRGSEKANIFENANADWQIGPPMPELEEISWGWSPEEAERSFLDWFVFLFGGDEYLAAAGLK